MEASAAAPSGFLTLRRSLGKARRTASRKRKHWSRKTIRLSACASRDDVLLFPSRRRGNSETGPKRRETAGRGRPNSVGNYRQRPGPTDGKPSGRSDRTGGKPSARSDPKAGKPAGRSPRRHRETGGDGPVARPSGDPSGSSSELTASRPKGLHLLSGDGEGLLGNGESGSGCSDLRVAANPGTAVIFGSHSRRPRPTAPLDRSWVPGPTMNGIENPERVEASAKAPSGFLASWGAGPIVSR